MFAVGGNRSAALAAADAAISVIEELLGKVRASQNELRQSWDDLKRERDGWRGRAAVSDEAGQAFRQEAGHRFRVEAGRDSDLMSATWHLLPRIAVMMFCPERLVKRSWIWISAKARVAVGNGGRSALSIAP